jgi:hypothetical protein
VIRHRSKMLVRLRESDVELVDRGSERRRPPNAATPLPQIVVVQHWTDEGVAWIDRVPLDCRRYTYRRRRAERTWLIYARAVVAAWYWSGARTSSFVRKRQRKAPS